MAVGVGGDVGVSLCVFLVVYPGKPRSEGEALVCGWQVEEGGGTY